LYQFGCGHFITPLSADWWKITNFTQCSPKVNPGGTIFDSVLAANIDKLWLTAKNFEPGTA